MSRKVAFPVHIVMVWFSLAAVISVAGCQTPGDVKRTWQQGWHQVPESSLQEGQFSHLFEIRKNPETWRSGVTNKKLRPGTKVPAVVYLHGCAGNTAGYTWGLWFARNGYAFFAPDSLQRPREPLCWTGQMESIRIPMRLEELHYALQQLRKLEWIDQKRIILMGSSEGAQAAAAYGGDSFSAVVLIGTDCRFSGGSPNAPRSIPVLSMVGSKDNQGGATGCAIGRTVRGSKSAVIPGAPHKLGGVAEAHKMLSRFLKDCCG